MKEMIILITMFFADPLYTGQDAITIDSYNGKPLIFTNAPPLLPILTAASV